MPKQAPKSKDSREFKDLLGELATAQALSALRNSEGGKALVKGLVDDILGAIDVMVSGTATLTHVQFIALSSRIKERLDIATALSHAKSNAQFLQENVREALEKIEEEEAIESRETTNGDMPPVPTTNG